MTQPGDQLNIEDNKVVRRHRRAGCTCTWIWVDGAAPGSTEPAVDLPYAADCTDPEHQN